MPAKKYKRTPIVRIRIRIGQYELEVKGPREWAEKAIDKFVARRRKEVLDAKG